MTKKITFKKWVSQFGQQGFTYDIWRTEKGLNSRNEQIADDIKFEDVIALSLVNKFGNMLISSFDFSYGNYPMATVWLKEKEEE